MEWFQCAGKHRNTKNICPGIFKNEKQVEMNYNTMLVTDTSISCCPKCKAVARPNVLMFRDKQWIPNTNAEARYVEWEAIMENHLEQDNDLSLVILEIGCGMRVPSVRLETECVVNDIRLRGGKANLIRINPEQPSLDDNCDIYLQGNGLGLLSELLYDVVHS